MNLTKGGRTDEKSRTLFVHRHALFRGDWHDCHSHGKEQCNERHRLSYARVPVRETPRLADEILKTPRLTKGEFLFPAYLMS